MLPACVPVNLTYPSLKGKKIKDGPNQSLDLRLDQLVIRAGTGLRQLCLGDKRIENLFEQHRLILFVHRIDTVQSILQ